MNYIVHTDGGARGNPGPAAIGVVIEMLASGEGDTKSAPMTVQEYGAVIGETTNNVAEYTAVVRALESLEQLTKDKPGPHTAMFYLDSLLVVNQLNGLFKVKEARLRELLFAVRELEGHFRGTITYTAVPRELNIRADRQVNRALDAGLPHV